MYSFSRADALRALKSLQAVRAAMQLKLSSYGHRLLILPQLTEAGEMNVSQLAEVVDLSQSALSQHLAKSRADGSAAVWRESQTIWRRIADDWDDRVLKTLCDLFFGDADAR